VSNLADTVVKIAEGLEAAHEELNRLDAAAGDGDLGNTVMLAAQAVRASINAETDANPAGLLRCCGSEIATSAPSTSGTLAARALLAAARAVDSAEQSETSVGVLAIAFKAALAAVQSAGKAAPGDRTMLDALAPAAEELSSQARAGVGLTEALAAAAAAARRGADATRFLTPRAGRARWLAQRSKGTEDAGAHLVALVLALAADAVA
jgi:dihydroxyacetone kinase